MDKEYIQRLKDMLADADAKIASVDNIEDPTEREVKRSMFLDSRKEIEELLKKAGGSVKKAPTKKVSKPVAKKTTKKPAAKESTKKPVVKKAPAKKKPVAKKSKTVKKPAPKKPAAKKVAKKPVAKKAPAKKVSKPVAKKAPAKKLAKKQVAKKAPVKRKPVEKVSKLVAKQQNVKPIVAVENTNPAIEKPVEPISKSVLSSNNDEKLSKKQLKEIKKREKEQAKLEKKQEKEWKKEAKKAEREVTKTDKVNGYEIPQYSDDVTKLRNRNVPKFGTTHPEMTDKELALNTIYASMFYANSDDKYDKQVEDHKPISVGTYDDKNYVGAIQPYKDTKQTPTAKVGVEAGSLTNVPVANTSDNIKADEAVIKEEKKQEKAEAKEVKAEAKKTKVIEKETPIKEEKVSEVQQQVKPTESKAKSKVNEQRKKELEKQAKLAEKEYKKAEKAAKKNVKKTVKVNGYEIPQYSDDISIIRNTSVPEFGSQHKLMSDEDLILNSTYASLFAADSDDKDKKNSKTNIQLKPYDDKNYQDVVAEYKDTKQTPTAKVGVEAGPLTNVPVANSSEDIKADKAIIKEEKKQAKAEAKKIKEAEAQPVEPTISAKEQKKIAKQQAKEAKEKQKEAEKLAKKQQKEAMERETEMERKVEEEKLAKAKDEAYKKAEKQKQEEAKKKAKEEEINRLAAEASEKAAKQQKAAEEKAAKEEAKNKKSQKQLAADAKKEKAEAEANDKRIAEQSSKRREVEKGEFIKVDLPPIPDEGVKSLKQIAKRQKQLTSKYSKQILDGAIVTTTDYKPDTTKHVIELHDVVKSYITGDIETPVLKGVNLKLDKGDFIVILGPSGSGKTTFLNTISGLDKATKGDVFVLGYNLSYLKDSHLTKFRRKHVGFIFQQYNLLTNLTARENAEVGENLSAYKNPDMTIEDIFETIGMKEQMNKYPHQMSGGQQQRVSIARALAKNPDILFADEPTGALDEEMGRKVLEILVEVNKRYGTTVIVVTHNPNIAKIGNTVIHIRNGKVAEVEKNKHPEDPSTIEWA